jgi:hypothetical protein
MPQLQAYVPDPVTDDLPCLLSGRPMATPAIRVDLLILVSKHRLEGPSMHLPRDDIGSGERFLRQVCEEECVDDALARDADPAFQWPFGMGRHHHAAAAPLWPYSDIRAVVAGAHQGTFWAAEVGIGGQVQPRPHDRVIQHRVVFAPHDEGEASQIRADGPRAIEALSSQQGACLRQAVRSELATDDCEHAM